MTPPDDRRGWEAMRAAVRAGCPPHHAERVVNAVLHVLLDDAACSEGRLLPATTTERRMSDDHVERVLDAIFGLAPRDDDLEDTP